MYCQTEIPFGPPFLFFPFLFYANIRVVILLLPQGFNLKKNPVGYTLAFLCHFNIISILKYHASYIAASFRLVGDSGEVE